MTISIVSASDDKFVPYLGVMLFSLLRNKNTDTSVEIYIIDNGISAKNRTRLSKLIGKFRSSLIFLSVNADIYKNFRIDSHINHTTYCRLSIPELFNREIKKILYIDGDVVVRKDLSSLWNIDISDYYMAAVKDWGITSDLPRNNSYFNAGIMLLNLNKIRCDSIMSKTITYIEQNRPAMHDQDGLNAIVKENYLSLPVIYNTMSCFFFRKKLNNKLVYKYSGGPIIDPYMIHFTGSYKVGLLCNNPYRYLYYRYLLQTQWRWHALGQFLHIPSEYTDYTKLKYKFLKRYQPLHKLLRTIKANTSKTK